MLIPVASRICDMEQTLESYILNASFILDLSLGVEKSMEAAQLATILALEPAGSLLLESEIKRWLKYNISKGGADDSRTYKKFQELVDRGIIQGKRHGKSKNSHVYYNKGEIKKAFAEVEIMQRLAEAEGRR